MTALQSKIQNKQIIKLLLKKGAKLDTYNFYGQYPIWLALKFKWSCDIVRLLVKKGAKLS